MSETLLSYEAVIRLSIFGGMLLMMALWEALAPRRYSGQKRGWRWPNNLGVIVIDTLVVRFVVPTTAVAWALMCSEQGWGLLNAMAVPAWPAILGGMLLLDLIIYGQHRLFHAVPWLWRLHRMHHSDTVVDVTTGIRFHPLEILLSMAIKLLAIWLLGVPAVAVLLFEVVLNATSLFNHSNIHLQGRWERLIRLVVVTPDMHRIHHSVTPHETDSNFGFNLPWWDWLFRTYRAQPEQSHEAMALGLTHFREDSEQRLDKLMVQPLR